MLYMSENPHGGDIYENNIKLDFSANLNPFGTPEGVKAAIRDELQNVHHYPDPYCRKLIGAISEFESLPREYIFCGNGAAELIYSFTEAIRPKLSLELAPTFSEYSLSLGRWGTEVLRYELSEENNFRPDEGILKLIEENKPQVIFICNPNNPTGKCMDRELLKNILELSSKIGARLFLDECFMDLTDKPQSMKGALSEYSNLIILKAFTKSYGMAGIRLGYCLSADSELLGKMSETVQPWNVSSLAQCAGAAALGEKEFLNKFRSLIPPERERLRRGLKALGFRVFESEANFILFKGDPNLDLKLKKRGIAIRNCRNYYGLGPGFYRIAVKRKDENLRLLEAIGEALKEG